MAKNGVMRYPPFAHIFLAGAVLAMRGRRAGEGRGRVRRHSTVRCKSTRLPLAEVRRKARLGLRGAGRGGGLLPERRPASSQKTARGSAGAAGAPAAAVGAAERACETTGPAPLRIAAVVTNGRALAALRRGHPIW